MGLRIAYNWSRFIFSFNFKVYRKKLLIETSRKKTNLIWLLFFLTHNCAFYPTQYIQPIVLYSLYWASGAIEVSNNRDEALLFFPANYFFVRLTHFELSPITRVVWIGLEMSLKHSRAWCEISLSSTHSIHAEQWQKNLIFHLIVSIHHIIHIC